MMTRGFSTSTVLTTCYARSELCNLCCDTQRVERTCCDCSVDQRFLRTGSATVFVTTARRGNLGLVVLVSSRVDGCGPPTASPRTGPVYRGCPGRDPLGCSDARAGWHRRQSANPFCGCWSVLLSVSSCSGRGRGSRSNAIENTYTPARLEALFQLLVVILSHPRSYHSYHPGFAPKFRRVVGVLFNEILFHRS